MRDGGRENVNRPSLIAFGPEKQNWSVHAIVSSPGYATAKSQPQKERVFLLEQAAN